MSLLSRLMNVFGTRPAQCCSFCGKKRNAGPMLERRMCTANDCMTNQAIAICKDCVEMCGSIFEQQEHRQAGFVEAPNVDAR